MFLLNDNRTLASEERYLKMRINQKKKKTPQHYWAEIVGHIELMGFCNAVQRLVLQTLFLLKMIHTSNQV